MDTAWADAVWGALEVGPWALAAGVAVSFLAGVVQGTLGFGMGLVSVPILALVSPLLAPSPQVLLSLPQNPLCSATCEGPIPEELPVLVADDDEGSVSPKDPRWAALDDLRLDGDLQPAMRLALEIGLDDLTARHADLDELFLSYYQGDDEGGR